MTTETAAMDIQVLAENLNNGLRTIVRAVLSRTSHPMTTCVLLQEDKGRLMLRATDLDMSLTTWVGARIDTAGAIAVDARMLTDIVSRFPSAPVRLAMDGQKLAATCGKASATLPTKHPEDFPLIRYTEDGVRFSLPGETLGDALRRVTPAAASDDTRPVLTGVYVAGKDGCLTFATADGYRLHALDLRIPVPEFSIILPRRAAEEIQRLIGKSQELVEVTIGPTQLDVSVGDVRLTSKLIQGMFPNYHHLVPVDLPTKVTVNTEDVKRALGIVGRVASGGSGIVRFQARKGVLRVSAHADEVGDAACDLDAEIGGPDNKVALHIRYAREAIDAMGGKDIVLGIETPFKQALFTDPETDGFSVVVMPMFLNEGAWS